MIPKNSAFFSSIATGAAILLLICGDAVSAEVGPKIDNIQGSNVQTTIYVNDDGAVKGITEIWSGDKWSGSCVIPGAYFFDSSGNVIGQVAAPQRCVGANNPFDSPHHRRDEWTGKISNPKSVKKVAIMHFAGGKDPAELFRDNLKNVDEVIKEAKDLF